MKFEFYVLNYDGNRKKVENFNIFNNCRVHENVEKEVKKYLRAPNKYKYEYSRYEKDSDRVVYGFEAFCAELKSILRWQEWGRREYEISVSDAFTPEVGDIISDIDEYIKEGRTLEDFKDFLEKTNSRASKLEKWDCYMQVEPNIEAIAREVIYQYKKQLKNKEN